MNPLIEQVLSGNIDMEQFLKKLQDDPELQEYIRHLVPEEAKEDPSHVFWKSVSYPSVKRDHFDYYRFIFRMANSDLWASHPDGRIGKYLNIFSLLKKRICITIRISYAPAGMKMCLTFILMPSVIVLRDRKYARSWNRSFWIPCSSAQNRNGSNRRAPSCAMFSI